jgi:hypothetical protein
MFVPSLSWRTDHISTKQALKKGAFSHRAADFDNIAHPEHTRRPPAAAENNLSAQPLYLFNVCACPEPVLVN